jgi:hypothetical protein
VLPDRTRLGFDKYSVFHARPRVIAPFRAGLPTKTSGFASFLLKLWWTAGARTPDLPDEIGTLNPALRESGLP